MIPARRLTAQLLLLVGSLAIVAAGFTAFDAPIWVILALIGFLLLVASAAIEP